MKQKEGEENFKIIVQESLRKIVTQPSPSWRGDNVLVDTESLPDEFDHI